jgi:hypothetical protein
MTFSNHDAKEQPIPMSEHETNGDTDLEWQSRVLCSDGNCIGVIGPDGRCKECGRPYEGELPDDFVETQLAGSDESVDPGEDEAPEAAGRQDEAPLQGSEGQADTDGQADDDWTQRKLCNDGACIGVIGPDGLCKECGKPYKP